jgi:hypothetical protein
MKRLICQSKRKDGNQCKGNAMGATYFCYVHQDSKDPITYRDPMIEAFREWGNTMTLLIEHRRRTGIDLSMPTNRNPYRKRPNSNKRYTPPMRNK